MEYNYGQVYSFPVLTPEDENENYFYLEARDSSDNPVRVRLPKLKFQRSEGYQVPPVLNCRIKGVSADGVPALTHDIVQYVKDFYGRPDQLGEIFDFYIVVPTQEGDEYMSVMDDYGIMYRLKRPETPVRKGQRVKGRFYQAKNGYLNLALVREAADFPLYTYEEVCGAIGMSETDSKFIRRLIGILPELATVKREIEDERSSWPLTALLVMNEQMPRWFMQARTERGKKILDRTIEYMRALGLFLLEGSAFLNFLPDEERMARQQEVTTLVEGVKPYKMTLERVKKGTHQQFITTLLDRLQKSGFIYHPSRQFAVLMLIFRLFPQEVQTNLDRIFAVIFERKLSNWQLEPFRQAFIEQFDIYVKMTRADIDALPQVESTEERARLGNLLTAIALELLIAGKDGMPEDHASRLRSLFYRYASLVNAEASETLLAKSFLALMDSDTFAPAYTYENLKQQKVMLARAALKLDAPDPLCALESTHTFSNGYVELVVDTQGLRLCRSGVRNEEHAAVPAGWMPWLCPQISLAGVEAPTRSATKNINERAKWWAETERALFEKGGSDPSSAAIRERMVTTPVVGDDVFVQLTGLRTPTADRLIFTCRVIDDGYEPVNGTIESTDIVGYSMRFVDDRVWSENGRGRILRATVKALNPDGTYRFSLTGIIEDYFRDRLNYGDIYYAGVTKNLGGRFSAVCSEGFGLFLYDPDHINPKVGSTVAFRYKGITASGLYEGEILHLSNEDHFENAKSLTTLLKAIEDYYSYTEDEPEEEAEEMEEIGMIRDTDEILSREDVLELVQLMRFKAISAEKLEQAFDYIHYARLLARLADDEAMAADLATHASLLTMIQFFATNDRLDTEVLRKMRSRVEGRPLLENLYRRLDIIGKLGNIEAVKALEDIIASPHNELESNLARLALSYTLVSLACGDNDDKKIADGIRSRIKSLLNVNYEVPKSKYYGSESQFVEFKSSTVYKAVKQGQKSLPAAEEQRFELLHIIAGFLNAAGGTLYIGVNDRGYASGLFEDMELYRRGRQKVEGDWYTITDVASLALMLENLVRKKYGDALSRKVSVFVDDEAKTLNKDVIRIEVSPSYEPVYLDEKLFVRTSTSTRELRDEAEIGKFMREREIQKKEHEHAFNKEQEEAELKAAKDRMAEEARKSAESAGGKAAQAAASPAIADNSAREESAEERIETSVWKRNELHDGDDSFVQPALYLYFTKEGRLESSTRDTWRDQQPGCLLALAVLEEEIGSGWLFVGFDNGRTMKLRLSEIMEDRSIQRGQILTRDDARPVFAATVGADGFAVCFGSDRSGTLMRRAVPMDGLETSRLGGDTRPFAAISPERVLGWEVAPSKSSSLLSDCLPGKLSRNFGYTMRVNIDRPEARTAMTTFASKLGGAL